MCLSCETEYSQELLFDWSIILNGLAHDWTVKDEKLHDMTPSGILIDVSVMLKII